jgi:hypothetical protein
MHDLREQLKKSLVLIASANRLGDFGGIGYPFDRRKLVLRSKALEPLDLAPKDRSVLLHLVSGLDPNDALKHLDLVEQASACQLRTLSLDARTCRMRRFSSYRLRVASARVEAWVCRL